MTRILIIDDDETVRQAIHMVLSKGPFQVCEAEGGKQAIERAKAEPFDIIIIDMLMPGMDGLETIEKIRAYAPTARLLAISGGGRINPRAYLTLAEKLGAHQTLLKPFSASELLQTIDALSAPL